MGDLFIGQEQYSFASMEISVLAANPNGEVSLEAPGKLFDFVSISVEETRPIEPIYNYAQYPQSTLRGKYKAQARLTVMLDEWQEWMNLLSRVYGSVFDGGPFNIKVEVNKYVSVNNRTSELVDNIKTHTVDLQGCYVTGNPFNTSHGNMDIPVELPLYVHKVVRDGIEPTASYNTRDEIIDLLRDGLGEVQKNREERQVKRGERREGRPEKREERKERRQARRLRRRTITKKVLKVKAAIAIAERILS